MPSPVVPALLSIVGVPVLLPLFAPGCMQAQEPAQNAREGWSVGPLVAWSVPGLRYGEARETGTELGLVVERPIVGRLGLRATLSRAEHPYDAASIGDRHPDKFSGIEGGYGSVTTLAGLELTLSEPPRAGPRPYARAGVGVLRLSQESARVRLVTFNFLGYSPVEYEDLAPDLEDTAPALLLGIGLEGPIRAGGGVLAYFFEVAVTHARLEAAGDALRRTGTEDARGVTALRIGGGVRLRIGGG